MGKIQSGVSIVRRLNSVYLLALPGLILSILFLIIPIIFDLIISFYTYESGQVISKFTLENYIKLFSSQIYLGNILYTIRLASIVTAACLALGYPVAYLMAMHIKGEENKLILILLFLLPWWIDYTVRSIAWIPVLGREGVINKILMGLRILNQPSGAFLFNEVSAIIVMIQANLLFMIGPIFFSLAKIDKSFLEAAETLGASKLRAFYHIVFKMSTPGIIIGIIFVFIAAMADFATPRLIGGYITTIGLNIANQVAVLNWPFAGAISIILLMITLGLIVVMLKIVDIKQMIF